jgi:hypothetical protein
MRSHLPEAVTSFSQNLTGPIVRTYLPNEPYPQLWPVWRNHGSCAQSGTSIGYSQIKTSAGLHSVPGAADGDLARDEQVHFTFPCTGDSGGSPGPTNGIRRHHGERWSQHRGCLHLVSVRNGTRICGSSSPGIIHGSMGGHRASRYQISQKGHALKLMRAQTF